jgi:hypothetical protein
MGKKLPVKLPEVIEKQVDKNLAEFHLEYLKAFPTSN